MLVIMVVGIICAKTGIVTEKGNKELSGLLLMVVNPLVIFLAYQKEFSTELFWNLLLAFGLSAISFGMTVPLSHLLIGKKRKEASVERFAAIYSNCGFFGIPMVQAVLGDEGVFYLTAYLTMFNIMAWTHGAVLMGKGGKFSLKELAKNLGNVNVIAVLLGLVCFFLGIFLPSNLKNGLQYVANMNTPLAMLIAGYNLTRIRFSSVFKEKGVYLVSVLKLVVYPLMLIFLFRWIPVDTMVKQTILIAASCPVAANVTLFSLRFDRNAPYASALYALNTVFAMITMPLVLALI